MRKKVDGMILNTETAVELYVKKENEVYPDLDITCQTERHLYQRKDGVLFTHKIQDVYYKGEYMRTDEYLYPEE